MFQGYRHSSPGHWTSPHNSFFHPAQEAVGLFQKTRLTGCDTASRTAATRGYSRWKPQLAPPQPGALSGALDTSSPPRRSGCGKDPARGRGLHEAWRASVLPGIHIRGLSRSRHGKKLEPFLHIAGGSTLKGTEDILALWAEHPEWPELTLLQKHENAPKTVPSNVRLLTTYLTDRQVRFLQNRCGIHLCPSRAEGWGHYIVEAMSTGAVVVTTDAPPMNELVTEKCGVLVGWNRSASRHLGTNYYVDRQALENAISRLLDTPIQHKMAVGAAARSRFEAIEEDFRQQSEVLFGNAAG